MLKVGQVVKHGYPENKREAKRRWRVIGMFEKPVGTTVWKWKLRRLDTGDIEIQSEHLLVPISWWERLTRRIH